MRHLSHFLLSYSSHMKDWCATSCVNTRSRPKLMKETQLSSKQILTPSFAVQSKEDCQNLSTHANWFIALSTCIFYFQYLNSTLDLLKFLYWCHDFFYIAFHPMCKLLYNTAEGEGQWITHTDCLSISQLQLSGKRLPKQATVFKNTPYSFLLPLPLTYPEKHNFHIFVCKT